MTGDGIIGIDGREMGEVFICELSNFVTSVTTGRTLPPHVKSLNLLRHRGEKVRSEKEYSTVKGDIF